MVDAPFPICAGHARKLYEHLDALVASVAKDEAVKAIVGRDWKDDYPARLRKNAREQSFQVYYVRVADLIKIGYTENIRNRMKTYPPHTKLLATEPGGPARESQRHTQFKHLLAARNEWFHPGLDLMSHIESLVRGRVPTVGQ
jgi:hypothetical protein